MTKMPTLFISHGSPTIAIEEASLGRHFLSGLSTKLEKPKAILVISAHWETSAPMVSGSENPETIHDFYGFASALYQLNYPAPGSPALAARIAKMVSGKVDDARGLDHGAWSPLYLIYPDANIPVLQLSLQPRQSAQYHYDIGKLLAPLRDEGVLIIASGSTTHNLGLVRWNDSNVDTWAKDFELWFEKSIAENDFNGLLKAQTTAPNFKKAHPTPEHWLPIYVAIGAAHENASLLHKGFEHGDLSMAAARFD
jgi:4,5-DOPA dioxygenase extradiol